ncbi:hypothetical protein SODALDRAFT_355886 [Sodiomyces alkalinus F11]|uniref:Ubiquinol-cytochrome-c reductase cytochrome c1 n=1 Tax=Sodiomyces alkalinus (strain CBS 110278 / VKM F-3762 / F11) TaxID=1314773 RepID=A0A3N2QA67_SODAK|nr:hypothetical protein SODALDRAFT_355886 [Sodiomyces alkalinus F11]ROT43664.1 hypothetical protein SODALDRAFT_355886 [Sodiomyces alkalinus F11]
MAESSPGDQEIYCLCRGIFSGQAAEMRNPKKIKNLSFGERKLVLNLKRLLEARIFESDTRAKAEFPALFPASPPHYDTQPEESEADAADAAKARLDELSGGEDVSETEEKEKEDVRGETKAQRPGDTEAPANSSHDASPAPIKSTSEFIPVPSLQPCYLPYNAQHVVLNATQRILEECCFDFGTRWLPDAIAERGWECASAAELTHWGRIFQKTGPRLSEISSDALSIEASSLQKVYNRAKRLRNTAVHREKKTGRGTVQLLHSAQKLAEALRDYPRAAQLEELKRETEEKINDMEFRSTLLKLSTIVRLQEISQQREELGSQQQKLIDEMLKQHSDNNRVIGRLLEDTVQQILERRTNLTKLTETEEAAEAEDAEGAEGAEGAEESEESEEPEEPEEPEESFNRMSFGQCLVL